MYLISCLTFLGYFKLIYIQFQIYMFCILPDLIGVPNSLNFELVGAPNLISVVISLSH